MYKKCFNTFICCGWAYGCTLTLLYLCRWGPNFENLGSGRAEPTLWCHGWGCKPPLTASHIHIRCIKSVLAPSYAVDGTWVHPYTVVPVQMETKFRKFGVWQSCNDIAVSWLRLQTPTYCIPHPYWMYTQCVLAPLYAVDWHMGAPLHCYCSGRAHQKVPLKVVFLT